MTIQPERSGGAVTALFLSGEGGPHSPRGPFVLLNLRRVTTRGRERASERGRHEVGPIKITPAMPMLCRQLQPRYLSRLLAWTDISEAVVVHPSLPISP